MDSGETFSLDTSRIQSYNKEESLPFLVRIVLNSQVSGGCCVEAIGLSSTRLEVWKDEGEQL